MRATRAWRPPTLRVNPNNVDKPFMVNFVRNIVMAGPRPRLVIVLAKLINKWGPLAATAAIAFYFGKRFSKL
ncbi:hypothetical protein HK405_011820 [Cladochytrium tenue]|nr:hypothetical protein HK405_011820 [Cladochytrium tenue]